MSQKLIACLNRHLVENPKLVMKSSGRKLSGILRQSLQKRIQTKSPIQQHLKRCVNVGTDKVVRVSIGNQGRLAQRVFTEHARRQATTKGISQGAHDAWNSVAARLGTSML